MLDLLGGLLARVPIEAPPADEQAAILATLSPELAPLVPAAMETLATVHAAAAADRHVVYKLAVPNSSPPVNPKQRRVDLSKDVIRISQRPCSREAQTRLCSATGDPQRQSAVHAALEAAGIRGGELAQSLGRHFSLRDLIKWARRMQVQARTIGNSQMPSI